MEEPAMKKPHAGSFTLTKPRLRDWRGPPVYSVIAPGPTNAMAIIREQLWKNRTIKIILRASLNLK
jgi:hypothetical protein